MNRSKIIDFASETPIFKLAKSSLYSISDGEALESRTIPLNSNLLIFKDKFLERRFHQQHTHSKQNSKLPSSELKNNMLIFFIFVFFYVTITAATSSLLFHDGILSQNHLMIRIIFLLAIFTFSLCIIYSVFKIPYFLDHNKILFVILGILFISYLIICDERILSGITNSEYQKNNQNSMLVIACFVVLFRLVLFDNFLCLMILSLLTLGFLLAMLLIFSPLSHIAGMSDYLVLFVFLILQIIDAWQVDFRSKHLFWRKDQEEEALDPLSYEENGDSQQISTEIELLLQICDKIKQNIKQSSAVIMFKDIKNKLKSAQSDIEKVKRGIAHGLVMADVKFMHENIDEQDRVFLSEYCMDFSKTSGFRAISRRPSALDIRETNNASFPFSSYGVLELESVLSSLGKN